MAITFPVLSCRFKWITRKHSQFWFASSNKVLQLQVGVNVHKAMIKSLPLTLESVVKSAKAVTPYKNPSTLWPKLFLIIQLTFSLSKEEFVLWPTLLTVPWITLLGKSKLSCIRSLNKPLGLKSDPFCGVFVWLPWFWYGSWGPWLQSADTGNYPANNNSGLLGAFCSLKKL